MPIFTLANIYKNIYVKPCFVTYQTLQSQLPDQYLTNHILLTSVPNRKIPESPNISPNDLPVPTDCEYSIQFQF